jgi:hypothetical protein
MPTRILTAGVPDIVVNEDLDEVEKALEVGATDFARFQVSGADERLVLIRRDAVVRLEDVPEVEGYLH